MTNVPSTIAYIGEFTHQLDAKNRLSIPAAWRVSGDDGDYYFAWPHPEGCIAVYPPEMRAELLDKARHIRQSDMRGQALLRNLFGKGFQFGCDKQGRILLPEPLVRTAGIERAATLVGLGRNFQIWSAERYAATGDEMGILAAMEALGI
jgi:MraZ protein